MSRKENKKQKRLAEQVLDQFHTYKSQSSARLAQYDENLKWFNGNEGVMYKQGRESWQPKVLANIIESNVRTLTSVLTDSNPILRVQSYPLSGLEDDNPQFQGMDSNQRDKTKLEIIAKFNEANDNVLNHVWRVTDSRKKLKKVVLDGCLTGMMVSRCYWDESAYGYR